MHSSFSCRIARASAVLVFSFAILLPVAQAQHAHHGHQAAPANAKATPVAAELRAVDAKARRLTLRHAALPHLGMPAMTMVFGVAPSVVLPADLKPGDKLQVLIEERSGELIVTALQR